MDISGLLFNGLSPYHASPAEIVRTEFDGHFVAGTEDNSVPTHVPAGIDVDFVVLVILKAAPERPAFEDLFDDGALIDSHFFLLGWYRHRYRTPRV